MSTVSVVMWILGVLNVYLVLALTRLLNWQKEVEKRIGELESCKMTEERFRKIMQEELQAFELRLIKEGRLEIG
jgi:hypothetical protein